MNPSVLTIFGSKRLLRRSSVFALFTLSFIVMLPAVMVLALTNLNLLVSISNAGGGLPNGQNVYTVPANPSDSYSYGYCTYWAALRRIQIGEPIPNTWGNAINWNINAMQDGYIVNHIPSYGAIFQWPLAPGGEGHVAFVENVDVRTGNWTISEMNAVGWDIEDERTYPANAANYYNFIHGRSATNYGFPVL